MTTGQTERTAQALHRLIMLSDGVFAIAMTLLAIEIHPPEDWNGQPQALINAMAPMVFAYAVSFAAIGGYWGGHRRLFSFVRKADGWMVALNFLTLGLVALLPAGVELLRWGAEGFGLAVYLGLIAAIGVSQSLMWLYALIARGLDPAIRPLHALVFAITSSLIPILTAGSIFYAINTRAWWPVAVAVGVLLAASLLRRRLTPDR